jgi:P27 family predicted phage terminase small subunit
MGKLAGEEWKRIIAILREEKSLEEIDIKTLEIYCVSYENWRNAEEDIQKNGTTFKTDSGYEQIRPAVNVSSTSLKNMQAAAKELGLTTASRARIQKNKGEGNKNKQFIDDEIDDMIAK